MCVFVYVSVIDSIVNEFYVRCCCCWRLFESSHIVVVIILLQIELKSWTQKNFKIEIIFVCCERAYGDMIDFYDGRAFDSIFIAFLLLLF